MEVHRVQSSLLKNGEYWFTRRDQWLWIVEVRVARRLTHFPQEYAYSEFKVHSGLVVERQKRMLVLDTTRL